MAKSGYQYFDRDISWLSFNERVLQEALDEQVPIYERLNFLSIFSSNLEEFYQVRVASAREAIRRRIGEDTPAQRRRIEILEQLTAEVERQEAIFRQVWEESLVPGLQRVGVEILTHFQMFEGEVRTKAEQIFREEVFPYLQPVLISPGMVKVFVRDKRVYLGVHLRRHSDGEERYYMIKLPFTKVPRFIPLPDSDTHYRYTFVDEIVRYGLPFIFPGYEVLGSYSFKASRDADLLLNDGGGEKLAKTIEELISKRKIGDITRFQYDSEMPRAMLELFMEAFGLGEHDLLVGRRHLQLQDVRKLPNPIGSEYAQQYPDPIPHYRWDRATSKIDHLLTRDEALCVPYSSFDYLLRLLDEASRDERVRAIKLTQYRVADDSEVIDKLIKAASSGKEVTVFVELKARFDEENNLQTAERMRRHGIKILYSLPGLKVHAKTCFIAFHKEKAEGLSGIGCFSTGNFNESTARIYSDVMMFTTREELTQELAQLFDELEHPGGKPHFEHLLVASHGMVEAIHSLIEYETEAARRGERAEIILKMNALEDEGVITKLYEASEAGVQIKLLVRGICRAIPAQAYSKHITIVRLLDIYLEHARIWYFHHGGEERYYLSSADWMYRNLYRRIECAAPVYSPEVRALLKDILATCLADNEQAVYVDEHLRNIPKRDPSAPSVRTQQAMYGVVQTWLERP